MIQKKVSVLQAIDAAVKKLGLRNFDEDRDAFIEWVWEGELKIGSTFTFERKECQIQLTNYCGQLPSDVLYILGFKYGNRRIEPSTADFQQFGNGLTTSGVGESMATPNNAYNYLDRIYGFYANQGPKISITNGKINVNTIENGYIDIAYKGLCLDENGFPLVNDLHTDALSAYLVYMHTHKRYLQQKAPEHMLRNTERRWKELCVQARSDDDMPNPLDMRILRGIWNNLLPLPDLNHF